MLIKLYDEFFREKRYITNASPKTLKYYRFVFNIWDKNIGAMPSKANVREFVIKVQQSGVTPFTANSYFRGMNAFFAWLFENEMTDEHFKIKKLKTGKAPLKVFNEKQLKALLNYRPKTFAEKRTYLMCCFALDCGARIDEILSLTRDSFDFDNLLVSVVGKGDKGRILPLSLELRKMVFKFLKEHQSDMVFPSRDGCKLSYKTSLDQFKKMCLTCGVKEYGNIRCSWHTLRHTFATCYVHDGGNVFHLQRLMGHESLSVTRIYVDTQTEDLSLVHKKTSLISSTLLDQIMFQAEIYK